MSVFFAIELSTNTKTAVVHIAALKAVITITVHNSMWQTIVTSLTRIAFRAVAVEATVVDLTVDDRRFRSRNIVAVRCCEKRHHFPPVALVVIAAVVAEGHVVVCAYMHDAASYGLLGILLLAVWTLTVNPGGHIVVRLRHCVCFARAAVGCVVRADRIRE